MGLKRVFNFFSPPEAIYIAPQPYTLSSEGTYIHVRALTTLKWKNQ